MEWTQLTENCYFRLIDVGGQRTYRKKWIHYFDGVAAVLFVVSMAAYDQVGQEKKNSKKYNWKALDWYQLKYKPRQFPWRNLRSWSIDKTYWALN